MHTTGAVVRLSPKTCGIIIWINCEELTTSVFVTDAPNDKCLKKKIK